MLTLSSPQTLQLTLLEVKTVTKQGPLASAMDSVLWKIHTGNPDVEDSLGAGGKGNEDEKQRKWIHALNITLRPRHGRSVGLGKNSKEVGSSGGTSKGQTAEAWPERHHRQETASTGEMSIRFMLERPSEASGLDIRGSRRAGEPEQRVPGPFVIPLSTIKYQVPFPRV